MRTISDSLRTKLNSRCLVGEDAPSCKVVWVETILGVDYEHVIPQIMDVQISKQDSAFSQTCSFTLANVNPSDPTDFGYFNPHRSDSTHNKPSNSWYGVIVPNKKIRVYMGYGSTLVTVFTGLIDTIEMSVKPDEAVMSVKCKDMGKLLLDNTASQVVSSVKSYLLEYPISVGVTTFHLLSTDTDPNLEDIVVDVCMRAGISYGDIVVEATGVKLSDTELGEFEKVTYSQIIEQIKTLTVFDFGFDEDGKAHFTHPQSKNITVTNEAVCMFGVDPQLLGHPAVESSVIVKNWGLSTTYTKNIDYTYDSSTNTLVRLPGGAIASDAWVKVSYSSVDFIFKNGQNIFQLPLTLSHDNIYGTIVVTGDGVETIVYSGATLWDGSVVLVDKVLFIEDNNIIDQDKCDAVADRLKLDMLERYTSTEFDVIPVPNLQLRDIIQIIVYGTISEAYLIDGMDLAYTASEGSMTQSLKCHHWAYAPIT